MAADLTKGIRLSSCLSRHGNWLLISSQHAGRDGPPQGTAGPHHFFGPRAKKIVTPTAAMRSRASARSLDPLRPACPLDVVQAKETTMFTKTFTLDRHIEELRAELHGSADIDEACFIKADLEAMLMMKDSLTSEAEAEG